MNNYLAAFLYTGLSIGIVHLAGSLVGNSELRPKFTLFVLYMALCGYSMFVGNGLAATVLIVATLYVFSLSGNEFNRLYLYFGALAALPLSLSYHVPAVGIEFLIDLTYPMMLSVAVLVPLIPKLTTPARVANLRRHRGVLASVVGYFLLTAATEIRDTTVTNGFRFLVTDLLQFVLPIFIVVGFVDNLARHRGVHLSLVGCVIILAALGLVQQFPAWNFSIEFQPALSSIFLPASDFRNGLLRTGATMMPIPLGIVAALSFVSACTLLHSPNHKIQKSLIYLAFLVCAVYYTGSRAGLIVIGLGMALWMFWLKFRLTSKSLIFVVVTVITAVVSLFGAAASLDEHGTFAYRLDLLNSSLPIISQNFLFGSSPDNYLPQLEHMRQGQGIIDIVNAFIQVSLNQGIVGLILFLAIPIACLVKLVRAAQFAKVSSSVQALLSLQVTSIICLLVALSTVSFIDFLPAFYWFYIATTLSLCTCFQTVPIRNPTKTSLLPPVSDSQAR